MKAYLDCVPCAMRQALEASRMATDDEEKQEHALREVAKEMSKIDWDGTPLTISHKAARLIGKITGVKDPYKDVKNQYNERAMEIYPEMEKKVSNSEDSLLTATKLSIAGNIIDFGPDKDFDIEDTVEKTLNKDFAIDNYEDFKKEIEKAEDIIYLSDNTGEIVFDKLLLKEINDKNIDFYVKGSPILNDAMAEDAKFAGIDEIARIKEIDKLDDISKDFIDKLSRADLIISKGQANYEALSEVNANIFFLLMVKCPLIGDDIGAEEGSTVVAWSKAQED